MASVIVLVLFILMELEFLLDNSLNIIFSETLNQIKFVFENYNAEKYFSVFELSLSKLEFSYLSNFFQYWLNFTFELLIKSHQLYCTIHWIWTIHLLGFFVIIFSIYHVINLSNFLSDSYFWSISFVIYDDSFP